MKRQRMLQQSAPANSGLLSVAHQSGPQNSSVVPPQVIHRPAINQSMPQTRLNTPFVNQSQTPENKINSKLQKFLNLFFFFCGKSMAIDKSFLKSGVVIFHQKLLENSCFIRQLSRLVQVIKKNKCPKEREMAVAYLLASVSSGIRSALFCGYSVLCSHPHTNNLFQQREMDPH